MAEPRESRGRGRDREEVDDGMIEKLVAVNRVSKTVKGGRSYHGYRVHIATDRQGIITDYVFDTASVSEFVASHPPLITAALASSGTG